MTYKPPTGLELRALLKQWEVGAADVAQLVDVTPRTVRRWCADHHRPGVPPIPYAALFTLAQKLEGAWIRRDNWREELTT